MTEKLSYHDLEKKIRKLEEEVNQIRDQKSILQISQDVLNPQRKRAKEEKADKLRTAYLANLSQEIRTPLNAITGYSQLINKPGISIYKIKDHVSKINRNNKILYNLIDGIVDCAKFSIEQNQIIKFQNELIEIHRNLVTQQIDVIAKQALKITDSIHYASIIQSAILPPEAWIKQIIPDFFILFKPRDIVSGDFYWVNKKNNKIVIAVVDCTGHGVPGSLMSMLGVALLNEIVIKNGITKPDEILNQLRDNVIKSLHQTGRPGEAHDGMDITLCVLDEKKNILEFSGAFNPLFILRSDEIFEMKADKMPIGIHIKGVFPFIKHETELKKGDILYLFTDGYLDQFGGKHDKKFTTKRFKQLLTDIHKRPMEDQKGILNTTINKWRSNREQLDDILIMGIKV